jgi:hypothetical protein
MSELINPSNPTKRWVLFFLLFSDAIVFKNTVKKTPKNRKITQ